MATRFLSVVFLVCAATAAYAGQDRSGILLLAHGGSSQWNERVTALARAADRTQPPEVAFGMASRASIQAAIDRLTARGVTEVIAVPLFVSSHRT